MYCLDCKYDLRGQTTPRCPECGRAFDPADPSTYYDPAKSARRRAWDHLRAGWRKSWLYIGILWAICTWFAASNIFSFGNAFTLRGRSYDAMKLRLIVRAWTICQNEDTCGDHFDLQSVLPYLEPRLDRHAIQWMSKVRDAGPIARSLPPQLFAFCLFSFIAFRGESRRKTIAFAACSCLAVVLWVGVSTYETAMGSIFKESFAYVNDYVYLTYDDDLTPVDHVIAYSREPILLNYAPKEPRRYNVAFGGGHVECMMEQNLEAALAAQGETLASPP